MALIGEDYPKIELELFGLELLEPMALAIDTVIAMVSFVIAYKLGKRAVDHPYFTYWKSFFYVFGLAALVGGFGHLFYNYWGLAGKIPTWILAPISVYVLEQGMISVYPNPKKIPLLKRISFWKYIVVVGVWLAVLLMADLSVNEKKPFLPIIINSGLSLVMVGIVMTTYYAKKIDPNYKYITYGTIMSFPALFVTLFKINLHPWFNREDFGHVMIVITLIYYYIGLKKISRNFSEQHNPVS